MGYLYEACDQISDFLPSIVAEKNVTKNDPSDSYFLFAEEPGYHK
jgi:hypothetical protein